MTLPRRWRPVAFVAALVAAAAAACFSPELPDTAFSCGDGGACPSGFACGPDGCCHREGAPYRACVDGGGRDGGDRADGGGADGGTPTR